MISAVIPAYNEESTLSEAVMTTAAALEKFSPSGWEIVIIDDGSKDRTFQIGQQLAIDNRIHLFRHIENRGKGAAVRTGVLQTLGEVVLIMDADLSTHPGMLESFIPALDGGVDLITGDRRHPEASIKRPQTVLRQCMGAVYAAMARLVTGSSLRDFNCGFKLMRGDVARSLLSHCRSDRWAWDVELIALAARSGVTILSIPVTWSQSKRTSVRPLRDAVTSLVELAGLWRRLRKEF